MKDVRAKLKLYNICTAVQVTILKYARKQHPFQLFSQLLKEFSNSCEIKSSDCRKKKKLGIRYEK